MPDIATDPIMLVIGSAIVPVTEPTLFTSPGRFWLTAVPGDVSRSPDRYIAVCPTVHVGTVEELTARFHHDLTRAFHHLPGRLVLPPEDGSPSKQTAVLRDQYPAAAGQAVPYVCGVGHYRDLCHLRRAPASGLAAEHRDLLARLVGQYVGERANARDDDEAADVANRLSPDVPGMVRPTTDPGAVRLLIDALTQLLNEAKQMPQEGASPAKMSQADLDVTPFDKAITTILAGAARLTAAGVGVKPISSKQALTVATEVWMATRDDAGK